MSVLVKGMKMPNTCVECPAEQECWCGVLGVEANERLGYPTHFGKRRDDCPLILVPDNGEWIEDKYTRKCSVCGSTYWMRGGDEWNYCPNCGAKNGEENGND